MIALFGLLVLASAAVSAADQEAPTVKGPEDLPGADVIVEFGSSYELNATGSTDNVGIVLYSWEIEYPDASVSWFYSTTPTYWWTPTQMGAHRVISWAEDADANAGYYVYAIDIAEVISAQLIQNTDVSYDHSIIVKDGTLEFRNANIEMTGGRQGDPLVLGGGEMFTENVRNNNLGKLNGYWRPYYTGSYYGNVYRDTSNVLVGAASIRNSGGNYHYGFEYVFDSPADLTGYDRFTYWYKQGYYYGNSGTFYVYSTSGYGYFYAYDRPGSYYSRGWSGVNRALNWEEGNIGYYYDRGIDWTQVTSLKMYIYGWNSYVWIDGAYVETGEHKDNITESTYPSGDWAGRWSGFSSTSSRSIVGSRSLQSYYSSYSYSYKYYYWNSPYVDLSNFDAIRYYTYFSGYYYLYLRDVYFYDAYGRYARIQLDAYSYHYFHYYASYYNGNWYEGSIPFDKSLYYERSGFDWSNIRYMRMRLYGYGSGTIYLDGMEFYQSRPYTPPPPQLNEDIPSGIYAVDNGVIKMTASSFNSPEPWGAFIKSDNDLTVKSSTFDGLWGTKHRSIQNEGKTYGGVMVYNSDVILDDVKVTKAMSSGFYLENCDLDAQDLDFTGTGRAFDMSAGLIVAFANTPIGASNTVDVTASNFHDSPMGSGLMVLTQNARGDATVNLDDVYAYKNAYYGVVMEIVGWTGNLTVGVRNSEFELNSASGFTFNAHDTMLTPKTKVDFLVEDSVAVENGGYGFLFQVDKANVKVNGVIRDVESYDNTGNGVGFAIGSFTGMVGLYFENVYSHENLGNGMYIRTEQKNFKDSNGNAVVANGKLRIDMEGCTVSSNEGNGIIEYHKPTGSYSEAAHPTNDYKVVARNLTVEKNEGHGYYVGPEGNPQYGNRDAHYEFYDSLFSDNKGTGFYFRDYYYAYYYYGNYAQEYYNFNNCTFTYNQRGLEQYIDSYGGYGLETFVTIRECTFQDNDYEALRCRGGWYSYYDSGNSYFKTNEWDVQDSLIDGNVYLDISGAYDQGQFKPSATVTFINDTYTSDEPMFIKLSSYYYSTQFPFVGTVIYQNVEHTSPSNSDGLHIEVLGSRHTEVRVTIKDQTIKDALGHGVYLRFGTLYTATMSKSVTGKVDMVNLEILNVLEDGIHIDTWHAQPSGASSTGFYSLLDSTVQGASTGIASNGFSGEIRRTKFSNIREETIYTYFGVIDVFESQIGPISEANLRVDEKGAIRLWFELTIKVVWRDEPDVPVNGTTVEIKDNSWTILGVNNIDGMDGVLFSNLNSYTVLPEGIYTKNPYLVTADYIGIVKEIRVQLKATMEITIYLVDDISPRLTIESPKDGAEQRQQEVTVKGTSYDKHTEIDRVVVSTDGETWMEAQLSGDKFTWEYHLTDLDQGLVLIRARAYDEAGNMKEQAVTILVDSTPPNLIVITPEDGLVTNKRYLEIVGTTDVGAKVYINDQPVDIQYTLISHTLVLAEGPNAIKVAAVDYLGNINEEVRYVTLDTQAPYVSITNVEDGAQVNTKTITLIGETEKADVTITIAGEEVKVKDGRFTTEVTLTEGINDIPVYAVDQVGNERLTYLRVFLDQTAPWLNIVAPAEGDALMTMKDFTVSGYVEQGSRVFVNEREVSVSYGYFETTVSAPEGDFELTITAEDEAGNEMVVTRALVIDTIAPSLEVTYPIEGFVTNDLNIIVQGTIAGTEGEDMRFLELYVNDIPRLFDYNTGEFSQGVILEEGVNRIHVTGMDVAGNTATLVRTVMLDSKAPYLSVFIGNVRNDPNWNEPVSLSDFVYVSGFSEIGVALTIDGVSVDVDGETGYFNYTLALAKPLPGLKIFTKEIVVSSTDEAGNTVTQTEKVNRIEGATTTGEEKTSTAEWLILFLALVIFGMALVGAYGYNRIQSQQELIEAYETEPSPARMNADGTVVAPPPARPARGGRARQKPRPPEPVDEEEVVIDVGDDEEV